MIPRDLLIAILSDLPLPEVRLPDRIAAGAQADELVSVLARWTEALRQSVAALPPDGGATPAGRAIRQASLIGIGIVDMPEDRQGRRLDTGYDLGVAIYTPLGKAPATAGPQPGGSFVGPLAVAGTRHAAPVFRYEATFRPHVHPAGGRAAAVVSDGNGDYALTARHVIDALPIGGRVALSCANCPGQCHGTVAKKGHVYLDMGLVELTSCRCRGQYRQGITTTPALTGATVEHVFASAVGPVAATVMQGIGAPSGFVNPAAPLTFLTDQSGQPGDSGSAIYVPGPPHALVGTYSGMCSLRLANGQIARNRSWGHDADEALNLFQCTINEGIF